MLVPLREEGRRREPLHGELLAVVSALYQLPEYRSALASEARKRAIERDSPKELGVRLAGMLGALCSNMRSA